METQGMNLFSLLPVIPQVEAGNAVLPGVQSSNYSENKPTFFELFSQFTTQFQDQPEIEIGSLPAVTPEMIPETLTQNLLSAEFSEQFLLAPQLPVYQPVQGRKLLEPKGETIFVQGNNVQIPQTNHLQSDLKTLSIPELTANEISVKKPIANISGATIPPKTESPEQSLIPEHIHSPKIKQPDLPVIETIIDKPRVQSQTVARAAALEITQLTRAPERKIISTPTQSVIPVLTGSVEPSPAVESPKPSVPETVLQTVVKQPSGMQPELPLNRLGQTLIQMISKGEQKLEFRLDPPELGKLTMTVAMERDSVSVQMLTGNQAVRDLLLMQVDRLRAALADESITLGQMSVDISNQDARKDRQSYATENLLLADVGSESGEYQAASVMFKAQGGRLLDHFV